MSIHLKILACCSLLLNIPGMVLEWWLWLGSDPDLLRDLCPLWYFFTTTEFVEPNPYWIELSVPGSRYFISMPQYALHHLLNSFYGFKIGYRQAWLWVSYYTPFKVVSCNIYPCIYTSNEVKGVVVNASASQARGPWSESRRLHTLLFFLIEVFGLCTCNPQGLPLKWGRRKF